jgi:hypothetical protein
LHDHTHSLHTTHSPTWTNVCVCVCVGVCVIPPTTHGRSQCLGADGRLYHWGPQTGPQFDLCIDSLVPRWCQVPIIRHYGIKITVPGIGHRIVISAGGTNRPVTIWADSRVVHFTTRWLSAAFLILRAMHGSLCARRWPPAGRIHKWNTAHGACARASTRIPAHVGLGLTTHLRASSPNVCVKI